MLLLKGHATFKAPRQLWSVTRAGRLMDSVDLRSIKQDYQECITIDCDNISGITPQLMHKVKRRKN